MYLQKRWSRGVKNVWCNNSNCFNHICNMFGKFKRGVIKEYTKKLLIGILIVTLLLCVCISIDYADDTITNLNESSLSQNIPRGTIIMNNSSMVYVNSSASVIVGKSSDKIYTVKQKYPTITMTGKPSCRCGKSSSYTWRTRTYINWCPNCHRYGTLGNKHKWASRYENEITCFHCDSDFCINCGHEKYSWSKKYLRKC